MITPILLKNVLVASALNNAPCLPSTPTAPASSTILCYGMSFNVTAPESCPTEGCGIIYDVHGLTMNAYLQDANTGLSYLGPLNGYITVQPSAPGATWSTENYDKLIAFFFESLNQWPVDKKKVHVTGFSLGGYLSWWFGCHLGEHLSSIAPIASGVGKVCTDPERIVPKVPVLALYGWTDLRVSYQEGVDSRNLMQSVLGLETISYEEAYGFQKEVLTNEDGLLFESYSHSFETSYAYGRGHCFPNPVISANQFSCYGHLPISWGYLVIDFFMRTAKK